MDDLEETFNYDLERMVKMVESETIEVPLFENMEELLEWFKQL